MDPRPVDSDVRLSSKNDHQDLGVLLVHQRVTSRTTRITHALLSHN
jgi:hypothetical protein